VEKRLSIASNYMHMGKMFNNNVNKPISYSRPEKHCSKRNTSKTA